MNQTQKILNRLQGVKKTENGWIAKCPAHNDHQPSLSISIGDNNRILLHCFVGCTVESIVGELNLTLKDLLPSNNVCLSYPSIQSDQVTKLKQVTRNKDYYVAKPAQHQKAMFGQVTKLGCTLQKYSEAKRLPENFLTSIGIKESTYKGSTKLVIPYFDASEELVCRRYRLSITDGQKFAWEKGAQPCLYGLWRLKTYPDKFIVLVEGESDSQTLWVSDIPAIGLPGANMWNETRDASHLEKFDTVYIVVELDKGGESVLKSLSRSTIKQKTKLVFLPTPLKDVSSLYLDNPDKFKEKFTGLLSQAVSFAQYQNEQMKAQESEAWRKCQDLARSPDILNEVYAVAQEMGVTGEERTVKILYLSLVSRFLNRPVSIAIKGPSAAGKSYVLDAIVKLFPAEAYYLFTAMSDRTLAFTEAEFKHRVILLAEASGLASDFQSYLIRTLLSEGRIIYETVEKTKDGFKPRRIEKEGPTGFICTTTAINLHPENETRMLSLTVNDSKEQTRAILVDLADEHNQCNSVGQWHALQSWLETQSLNVRIPYARELAERVSPVAVRLRRDFTTLLNLIKANAILHQASRKRSERGEVIAILDDYRTVYWLIADLIAEGVEMTVPEAVRKAVEAVREITDKEDRDYATTRDIANYLRIDRRAAERRLKRAATLSYLKNNNPGRGKISQYVVGDVLPDDTQVLPPPESLTWSLGQTWSSGNDQVRQAQHAENTTKHSNMVTWSPENQGINKHKQIGEDDFLEIPI